MTSIWDDPSIATTEQFVTFDKVGDSATGVVTAIRKYTFEDKNGNRQVPQLDIMMADGVERSLTGGAMLLKAALIEARPEIGDTITVKLIGEQPLGQGKSKRFWNVDVVRGGAPATAAPATNGAVAETAPAEAPATNGAAPDPLAHLSPEARAAVEAALAAQKK